jgi:hypothetical protein
VCKNADCRKEARRRDNRIKQHPYKQRRQVARQGETPISTGIATNNTA